MLRPKKHITKQKIKEDKFISKTLSTADWIKRHQRLLIFELVGIVVVLLVVSGIISSRRAAEREASLLVLQAGYMMESNALEESSRLLAEAIERYAGSRSAGRATFMLAQILFQTGQVDSSRTLYERYLRKYGDDEVLKTAARAGLAAAMEASGDLLGAAEAYRRSAEESRGMPRAAYYLFQAARCYRLAGDIAQAVATYELITEEYPNNAEADRARIEKAILARQGG